MGELGDMAMVSNACITLAWFSQQAGCRLETKYSDEDAT
jgi:hypothetical protein